LEQTLGLIEDEVNYRWQEDTPTLIVWDCIASTQPKMVVEEKIGEKVQMCRRAAMLSEFFAREWMVKLGKSRIVLLMTNQLRDHPGVMYGEKEGPPGGKSIRYAARIRMRLDMAEDIPHPQEPSLVIGRRMNITIVKNKYTGRRNTFGVSTYLDRGIDNLHTSLAYAYDEHGTPQGRLHYQGKQWFRKELHLYLCEHPTEIDPFREHVRKLWMGETPSDD
jgi:RecA/RadA recombinase